MNRAAPPDLTGYVLGTLESTEEAAVEAYLARSERARAEVRELRASLVVLTEALPPAQPRAEVWRNVQAQLARSQAETDPAEPVVSAPNVPPAVSVLPPRPGAGRANRLAWSLAACFCLVAAGSLFWGVRSTGAYRQAAGEARLVAAFLAEPQVQKLTLRGPDNGGIGGVLLEPRGRALFVLDGAPVPGRAYQAWGHTGSSWEPGSSEQLVSLAVSQDKVFAVPTGKFAALYLSLEPRRGSPQPTRPLSRVSLTSRASTAPLQISNPTDGAILSADSVVVRGSVADGVNAVGYTLNGGEPVETGVAAGRFTFTVAGLREGDNTLEVRAVGAQQQANTATVTMTYTPSEAK